MTVSGRIPQSFLNELLDRTDLTALIDEHVPLKKRGNTYIACCPFHQEKTPSFNVIPLKGFYHCFGCGVSGNAISFLIDYLKHDFLDAIDLLADKLSMTVPRERTHVKHSEKSASFYTLLEQVNLFYQKVLQKDHEAQQYLAQRGISDAAIQRYQIGFAPPGWQTLYHAFPNQHKALLETGMLIQNDKGRLYDRYRQRIMFPIHDRKGRIVGFGGRVINPEDSPKYLNSPETPIFHKSRELYGLYQALQTKNNSLLVVEGYMDVVALSEHQIQHAVATLGTATNESNLNVLLRHHKTLYFCFDGDTAGKTAAWRALTNALPLLSDDVSLSFIFLPEGEDPDSLVNKKGPSVFDKLYQDAVSLPDFFITKIRQEVDLSTPSGRSRLISLAKAPINTLPQGAYKEIILNRLSELTRIEKERIEILLLTDTDPTPILSPTGAQRSKPTPMRTACALLIQYPYLLSKLAKPTNPSMLIQDGSEILVALLSIINESTTTAQLIEYWRGDRNSNIINRLAIMPLAIPKDGRLSELEWALDQLKRAALQAEIEKLLKKASAEPLNEQERRELQTKIQQLKRKTPAG